MNGRKTILRPDTGPPATPSSRLKYRKIESVVVHPRPGEKKQKIQLGRVIIKYLLKDAPTILRYYGEWPVPTQKQRNEKYKRYMAKMRKDIIPKIAKGDFDFIVDPYGQISLEIPNYVVYSNCYFEFKKLAKKTFLKRILLQRAYNIRRKEINRRIKIELKRYDSKIIPTITAMKRLLKKRPKYVVLEIKRNRGLIRSEKLNIHFDIRPHHLYKGRIIMHLKTDTLDKESEISIGTDFLKVLDEGVEKLIKKMKASKKKKTKK